MTEEPRILCIERVADRAVVELAVTPDLSCFEGHFPNQPILPGVVQIHWAALFARRLLAVAGEFAALEQVKFNAPAVPELRMRLKLSLRRLPEVGKAGYRCCVDFEFDANERRYSSGRLLFTSTTA